MADDHLLEPWGKLLDPQQPMPTVQLGRRGFIAGVAALGAAAALGGGPRLDAVGRAPAVARAAPVAERMVRVRMPTMLQVEDYLPDMDNEEADTGFDDPGDAAEHAFDMAADSPDHAADIAKQEINEYGLSPEDLEKIEHVGSEFIEHDSHNVSHASAHYLNDVVMPRDVYERFREKWAYYNNQAGAPPEEIDEELRVGDHAPESQRAPDNTGWHVDGQPYASWAVNNPGEVQHFPHQFFMDPLNRNLHLGPQRTAGEVWDKYKGMLKRIIEVSSNYPAGVRSNRLALEKMENVEGRLSYLHHDGRVEHLRQPDPVSQAADWLRAAAGTASQALKQVPEANERLARAGKGLADAFSGFINNSTQREAVHQTLRGGEATRQADRQSRDLDQLLLEHAPRLTEPLTIFRPLHREAVGLGDESVVGQHLADRSYLSGTTDASKAAEHAQATGAVMAVHLPAGTPVLRRGDDVVMPRGQRLEITRHDAAADGTHFVEARPLSNQS